jgi:oxygen-independent coproporphyrinogen III oxidase
LKNKDEIVDAILKEITERKEYLEWERIETIYFGGGTPSLLTASEIEGIIQSVKTNYSVERELEITLEANPDDLSKSKLEELKLAGINRLSIGIQSFSDRDLKWLNRIHDARQAIDCIENAHNTGFDNITIDLIYGIPGQEDSQWIVNLELIKSLGLPHFSAYALTVEPKTTLNHLISTGKIVGVNEEQSSRQFEILQNWCINNDFIAYEISNYGRPGKFSRHNTSYWSGKKYIGVGPSAHSFNTISRQWNVANNVLYLNNIKKGERSFEVEELTLEQQYNEYVMTRIRTIWGCDLNFIHDKFGSAFLHNFNKNAARYIADGLLLIKDNVVILSLAGKLLADKITSDLFEVS